jgi:hypothetical protein
MRLRTRVDRLERRMPPPPPDRREERRRWSEIARRFMRQTANAFAISTEAEQTQVAEALKEFVAQRGGPMRQWMRNLQEGHCRLPELTPEAMKAALLSWFRPDLDCGKVCNRCGLEYPDLKPPPLNEWRLLPGRIPFEGPPPWYDLPRLFDACPNCGASTYDTTWSHLTENKDLPWKALDGWMTVSANRTA